MDEEISASDERAGMARFVVGLRRIAALLLVIFIGLYIVFYFVQADLIFSSSDHIARDPSAIGFEFEDVAIQVDGETTFGWYVPLKDSRGTILYSHGNDSNISDYLGPIRMFRSMGFSMLIYDYGGFGKSTGRPSEDRCYADALAMWEYLLEEQATPAESIVLYGPSFGGGPTCELATRVTPAAVILENTFSSMADAAFKDYPWFPGSLFLRHRFENMDKVGDIAVPILVIHSRGDELYPFAHGQLLFERANEPKKFLEVLGGHGEGSVVSRKIYMEGVEDFLASTPIGAREPNATSL